MRKENMLVFIFAIGGYLILSLIVTALYFSGQIPNGISINDYPEYRVHLYVGVILLFLAAILMSFMSYFLYKVLPIAPEGSKRSSVENLFWGFLYIAVVAWIYVFVFGFPGFTGVNTNISINLLGANIMPLVVLTGLGNFVLMLGMYYIILFSLAEYKKLEVTIFYKRSYLLLVVLFIIAISPTNYYALIPPEGSIYTRPLLVFIHLLLSLTVSIYSSYIVFKARSKTEDKRYRKKLVLIGIGFIMFIFIFLVPAVGILLAPNVPLFVWYTIGFMILFFAMVAIYLGFITPSWFERFL